MIHFGDLKKVPGDSELVFSWEREDGFVRMWAIERLVKSLEGTDRQIFHGQVEIERAQMFWRDRGIEEHRVEFLMKNPERLLTPCVMMRMVDPSGKKSDLMLDGHHRYFCHAMMGLPEFRLYHLTEKEAEEFEVYGHPQPVGGLNPHFFSGIIPE